MMMVIIIITVILINICIIRLEAAMKTEKESMRSTLDSILAKVAIIDAVGGG